MFEIMSYNFMLKDFLQVSNSTAQEDLPFKFRIPVF